MSEPLPTKRYQIGLVGLLSLNFAVLFFDRNAINFLMPFIQPDLKLTNLQVGLLASALSIAWAVAGVLVGRYSDRTGRRKAVIVAATVLFSLCSVLSGLASGFLMLLGARLLMGLAEGGVLPVSQSLTAVQVDPRHRGLAMGVIQNFFSNLFGSMVAPIVLVSLAASLGWRTAFFIAGIPGLIIAALMWFFLVDPKPGVEGPLERLSVREAFSHRNILLCAVIAVLLISYLIIGWSFLPLFLTRVRGFDAGTMGILMSVLGMMAVIGSFAVPGLSDRFGRKPIMVLTPIVGVAVPLAAMFFDGPVWMLGLFFAFGWTLNGTFSVFLATIPAETVDAKHTATVMGLVLGAGEIIGGGLGPLSAGALADHFGLQAPLWAMMALCLTSVVVALGLKETAPRILGRDRLDGTAAA